MNRNRVNWWLALVCAMAVGGCDSVSIVGAGGQDAQQATVDAAVDGKTVDVITPTVADSASDATPNADAADDGGLDAMSQGDAATLDADASAADVTESDSLKIADVPTDVPDLTPASVETTASMSVRAGDAISVTCTLLNARGEVIPLPVDLTFENRVTPPDAVRSEGGNLIALRVGSVEVACAAGSLVDTTPVRVQIVAGEPSTVSAAFNPMQVRAGEGADVRCVLSDGYGNEIVPMESPTIEIQPSDMRTRLEGQRVVSERSGNVEAVCVSGMLRSVPATLEVQSALPANVRIERSPESDTYAPNEPITLVARVEDRFGNTVNGAMVEWGATPEGGTRDGDVWRFTRGGIYEVRATVSGTTEGGTAVTATVRLEIDSAGPSIRCVDPADVSTPALVPGSMATFRAQVRDASGVANVTVGGAAVTAAMDGSIETPITVRQGLNVVPVVATDRNGSRTETACVFLAAARWLPEVSTSDVVELRISQSAIDNGAPSSPITSINDAISTAANSASLRTSVRNALMANRVLYPNTCFARVFGSCAAEAAVELDDILFNGTVTTTLTLVDGGLQATARITNVVARISAPGIVLGGRFRVPGTVTLANADVRATFNISASGGRITVTSRGAATSSLGSLVASIPSLPPQVAQVAMNAVNSLRPRIDSAIRDNLGRVLTSTVSGLVSNIELGIAQGTFTVPRAESGGTVSLSATSTLSSLNVTSARIRAQVGSRVNASTVTRSTVVRGVPTVAAGSEVTSSRPVLGAAHIGFFGQVAQAMWRGGWFDQSWSNLSVFGGMSTGTVTVQALLPPAFSFDSMGRTVLDLLAEVTLVVAPSPPVQLRVAVRLVASATLSAGRVRFTDAAATEVVVVGADRSLTPTERSLFTVLIRALFEHVSRTALGAALPPVPTPSFRIPSSLSTYGLPSGRSLALSSPSLSVRAPWFIVEGSLLVN